jgi:hypothetical protein
LKRNPRIRDSLLALRRVALWREEADANNPDYFAIGGNDASLERPATVDWAVIGQCSGCARRDLPGIIS